MLAGEPAGPHYTWVVGTTESAVVALYSWLHSCMDIPGAVAAVKLIDGTAEPPEPKPEIPVLFLGLPGYISKKHARYFGWISANRWEKGAMQQQN